MEFRCPDPAANPYLAFPALLMAGLDGIKNKIEPPEPMDKDLYDLPPEEKASVKQVPGSLEEVLDTLEADHQWLLEGGVFTQDVIDTWIEYKRAHEVDAIRLRPHPHEFHMYYDVRTPIVLRRERAGPLPQGPALFTFGSEAWPSEPRGRFPPGRSSKPGRTVPPGDVENGETAPTR